MKLQREMEIDSLEQMCDLMCGGVEDDYSLKHEYSDLLSGETLWLTKEELSFIMDNMNEIGINTLMIQTCKDKFVCKVDEATVKEYMKQKDIELNISLINNSTISFEPNTRGLRSKIKGIDIL